LSTELNGLASGNTAISSVGGASGVFGQAQTGGYIWGVLSFVAGWLRHVRIYRRVLAAREFRRLVREPAAGAAHG
jgi:hypothetical protein